MGQSDIAAGRALVDLSPTISFLIPAVESPQKGSVSAKIDEDTNETFSKRGGRMDPPAVEQLRRHLAEDVCER